MSSFTYTDNIPNPPNFPSADVPNMQINTNSISSLISVDHIGFNDTDGGKHTVIHCADNISDPTNLSGYGEFYAKTVGSDVVGFYESALGVITQLTGPTTPLAAIPGHVYLPGGILIQWGLQTSTSGSGAVTFPIAFPTACFCVFGQKNWDGGGVPTDSIVYVAISGSPTTTGFNYINQNTIHTHNFFWLAIGK